ncbi:hypothetical protein LXL04_007507 [Taraxacum kok-saghyz]
MGKSGKHNNRHGDENRPSQPEISQPLPVKMPTPVKDNDSAASFGGIAESIICVRWVHVLRIWIENNTKVGDRKIQAPIRWKLARMNQSEIDELLRTGDYDSAPVRLLVKELMFMNAPEHGYMEIISSHEPGGCAALKLVDGERDG